MRNAVINSALLNAPKESLQLMFLNFIDIFTGCHLILIDFIDSPTNFCKKHNIKVNSEMNQYNVANIVDKKANYFYIHRFLKTVFPAFEKNSYVYKQALRQINDMGLLRLTNADDEDSIVTEDVDMSLLDLHKTIFSLSKAGEQFMEFIKSPTELLQ